MYYPEDAEVYLRAADMEDGRLFCAVFNLGLDPIDRLTLAADHPVTAIERLLHDGTFAPVAFTTNENGVMTLDLPCYTLDPVVLTLA